MRAHKKNIIDLIVALVGLVGAKALALIASVLIARNAGSSTFGEYSLFITIFVLLSEVPNSIETTFIRFANSPSETQHADVFQLLAIITKLIYGFLIILIGWQFSGAIAHYAFGKQEVSLIFEWACYSSSFMALHNSIIAAYTQKKMYMRIAFIRPIFGLLILAILISTMSLTVSLDMRVIMYTYFFVCLVLGTMVLMIIMPPIIHRYPSALSNFSRFMRVVAYLLAASLIGLIANRLDVFFLSSLLSFEDVGLYGAAIRISIVVGLITAGMTTIFLPNASLAVLDRIAFKKYLNLVLLYSGIQTIAAAFIIWNIDIIVRVLFGEEFASIGLLSSILIIQVLFEAYARGFQALIQCGPKPRIMLIASILRLACSVILLFLLVPIYGVIGGAISVALVSIIIGGFIIQRAFVDCVPRKAQQKLS